MVDVWRLMRWAQSGGGRFVRWRARLAVSSLRRRVDRGPDYQTYGPPVERALSALVTVAVSDASTSGLAFQLLDDSCDELDFLIRLCCVHTWSDYVLPNPKVFALYQSLLLKPASPTTHRPGIRLMRVFDAEANFWPSLSFRDSRGIGNVRNSLREFLLRPFDARADLVEWRDRIGAVLRVTDEPELLHLLNRRWQLGRWEALIEIVKANPYLPQGRGDEVLLALLKNRPELIDLGRPETVDVLVRGMGNSVRRVADGARHALLALAPGAARDRLCFLAPYYPAARQVVGEKDFIPRDQNRQAVFFFLTEQWDRYIARDPDGRVLREAYRQSRYREEGRMIRQVAGRLAGGPQVRQVWRRKRQRWGPDRPDAGDPASEIAANIFGRNVHLPMPTGTRLADCVHQFVWDFCDDYAQLGGVDGGVGDGGDGDDDGWGDDGDGGGGD